jgi:glycolate oxidase FAD binding subunit
LLSVSLRVIPRPEIESTLIHEEKNEHEALRKMNLWAGQAQSISAAAWDGRNIRIRVSGSAASIRQCQALIGGQFLTDESYWRDLNNFSLDFFRQQGRLWRVSVAPMSPSLGQNAHQLIDWGGAQRWIKSDETPETIRSAASLLGGYAECFSEDQTVATYHPLEKNLLALSQRFKAALDPAGILNPGRMYPEL